MQTDNRNTQAYVKRGYV